MKTSKRILSSVLAAIIVISAMAIGGISASAASLKAPKGLTVTNANHSLVIKWGKVSGAKSYELYRGTKLLETVTKTSARDYSVTGGDTYKYKVRAVNGSKKSAFSSTVKSTRINFTVITSAENVKSGIEIKWVMRSGVTKYLVERGTAGKYTSLGYTADLYYTDKTAVAGTKYTYRVTGYNSTTKSSSPCSMGATIARVENVTGVKAIKAVDPKQRQITVSWTGSTGADSYNIYRQKITDEDFVKVANVKSTQTQFVDTDIIANPSAYRYYVTASCGTDESVKSTERFVQTYGSTPAYFDVPTDGVRNYHVPLAFNVGDKYEEGKYLTDYFSYNGTFDVTIREGEDVVSVDDNVITAKKAGTAKVVIKVTDAVRNIIEETLQDDLVELLTSREVILEITVA
ncbi:MAG: hypothetical protein K6F88_01175 [Ruminococcus sp.]|nr:hypothetical protein [Ruminococcus sp.]